jgi:hypothetical protein
MKETNLSRQLKLNADTTEHSMNDAYRRITRMGKKFTDVTLSKSFHSEKRMKMLKQMITYFENNEEFEKCFVLMDLIREFGVIHFDTEQFK